MYSIIIMLALIVLFLSFHRCFLQEIIGVDAFATNASLRLRYKSKRIYREPSSDMVLFLAINDADKTSKIERIRTAVYQAPAQKALPDNTLAKLLQIADSLRVATNHGVDFVLFPELFVKGSNEEALDRQCNELNVIANVCGELKVACAVGYAEKISEEELKSITSDTNQDYIYNSIAAFNADGSRAGNYRSISAHAPFQRGNAFVESIPVSIQLRTKKDDLKEHDVKVGLMCGLDTLIPEHSRQLTRSGAKVLLVSGCFRSTDLENRRVNCVLPTRAMENDVPVLFANPEGSDVSSNGRLEFAGSSAIISNDGSYLACAPHKEGGDLPFDIGYFLPCEIGGLHAADVGIDSKSPASDDTLNAWDLSPKMTPNKSCKGGKILSNDFRVATGFGEPSNTKKSKK